MEENYIQFELKKDNFKSKVKFTIPKGKIVALSGYSGSGKSTIAKVICGLIKPDFGQIQLNNKLVFASNKNINIPPNLRNIGMVFQEPRLFPHLSVLNNLLYGQKRQSKFDKDKFDEVISILGIKDILKRNTTNLSGGEAQRISIGRALLSNPSILILDEPLTGLDVPRQNKILSIIKKINNNLKIPILFISHSLDEIIFMADKIILIEKGKIISESSEDSIISNKTLNYFKKGNNNTSLIKGTILKQDRKSHITIIKIDKTEIATGYIADKVGTNHILKISSNDISIATKVPTNISINNIIKCKIKRIKTLKSKGKVELLLQINTQQILSEITIRSFEKLKLKNNMYVYALIKAVSIVGK